MASQIIEGSTDKGAPLERPKVKRKALAKRALIKDDLARLTKYMDTSTPVLLLGIDCEAWDMQDHPVTEIGLAWVDTSCLENLCTGDIEWHHHVESRHIRVEEHRNRRNTYLSGCPEAFAFGQSEFCSQSSLSQNFERYITELRRRRQPPLQVVLLGHGLPSDIRYLQKVGIDMENPTLGIVDSIDTVNLMRVHERDPSMLSLGDALKRFGLSRTYLHNAGNDATYTVHVALAVLTWSLKLRGTHRDCVRLAAVAAARVAREAYKRVQSASFDSRTTPNVVRRSRWIVESNMTGWE